MLNTNSAQGSKKGTVLQTAPLFSLGFFWFIFSAYATLYFSFAYWLFGSGKKSAPLCKINIDGLFVA